jgi:hypothetical protein
MTTESLHPSITSQQDYDDMQADALTEHDDQVEAARARMNAAWKWPERSSWIDLQRMLPDLEHAAARAGWPCPTGDRLKLLTPARNGVPACIRWADTPLAIPPGGSALADTAAASRLILIGRIQAYESLGDEIENVYATHATNVTPLRRK